MNYRDKLSDLGIDMSKLRGNQGKLKCPQCSHTRKKKSDPCLSVNIEEGWYRCHNCDWKGSVKFSEQKKKDYVRPVFKNTTNLSTEILHWFQLRGISSMTVNAAKLASGMTWFPQINGEAYCIQYPYFRNGELINIKHRDANKNFRLEKDAELIFFGLDDLEDTDEYIVIVEGENDKLAWLEVGIKYVISVPNGASKSNSNNQLEYLDNCWSYFKNDKKVILAVDNDEPGMILREELSRRIGKDRCYKVDFLGYKDSNEVLVGLGPDALKSIILPENLIEYPLRGVVEIDDIWDEVEYAMDNGLPRGKTTGLYREFDEQVSFDGGKLCVVTGEPNSGKSPFVDTCMLALSIRFGWKWGICSMENKPLKTYIIKLTEKILGKFIRPGKPVPAEDKERVRNFLRNHFYFIEANYENNESDTLDFILNAAQDLVRKHGIKGLVIDPWNKIEHQTRAGENETNYVSRALDQIIRFEQSHDLFTFLVAHPGKPPRMGKGERAVPDLYSVSGSSNFYNKPDWGITVHRNYESELTEIHVNKVKWDHLGKRGISALKYNGGNGRLYTPSGSPDFTNWLDSLIFLEDKAPQVFEDINENNYNFVNHDGNLPEDAPF